MDNNDREKSIREEVLEAIKRGAVHMRPKWHFVLKASLAVLGGILLLLALLYLLSFVFFVLRRTGALFVPAFGLKGWFALFASLPWIVLLVAILFIVVLELLVRRYSFAYRRPLLYSAVGIVLLALLGGLVVERFRFHVGFARFAEEHRTPFVSGFYRTFGAPHLSAVHRGEIVSASPAGFLIRNEHGETLSVVITPTTRLPFGMNFGEGDMVVVFGEREGDVVSAFGVRKVEAGWNDMPFHGPMPHMMRFRIPVPQ